MVKIKIIIPFSMYSFGAQSGSEDCVSSGGGGGGGGGGPTGCFFFPSLTFKMSSGLNPTDCCLGGSFLGLGCLAAEVAGVDFLTTMQEKKFEENMRFVK